jgi:hypothetical protein
LCIDFEIVDADTADREQQAVRRKYRAPGLEYGWRNDLGGEEFQPIRARFQRRETFRRRHDAGQRDETRGLGGAYDIGVEVRRDDELTARVFHARDVWCFEHRSGADQRACAVTFCQTADAVKRIG